MNAPKYNFDADGHSDRLPSIAANDSRSITQGSREAIVSFATEKFQAQEESASDFRTYFFKYLGIALKYRWLIVTCCAFALLIGLIVTFTATPIYRATVTIQIDRQA